MSRDVVDFRRWGRSGARGVIGLRSQRGRRHRLRPGLLELEERLLLATFTVTNTDDGNGAGTLRSAIAQANETAGANTISFDATVFSTPKTITLAGLLLELSNTTGTQTIAGPAAGVTISGGGQSRVFQVDAGVTASISGLTVTRGSVGGPGGGLYNLGTTDLTNCTISGNSATNNDGGGLFSAGTANLTNCTISGNSAGHYGGGLLNDKGSMTLTGCTLSANKAGYDGAGLANRGTTNLTNCTVSGNSAAGFAGGLFNTGTTRLAYCTLKANYAKYYGGLDNSGMANLTDCTLSSNLAANNAGGMGNSGTANLTNCVLDNNVAGFTAAGLKVFRGTANLTNCTLSGNSAQIGGGLLVGQYGTANLTNCTLSGNSAKNNGGGLMCIGYTANLTDCTVTGNSANNGGGLYNQGTLRLTACTVSGNSSAKYGGGLYNLGFANLTDTIVAGNTRSTSSLASDIHGGVSSSSSYNLIGPGGNGGLQNGANGNIVLGDLSTLGLAPLGFYGGPTQTMALLPGSKAIGNGTAVSGVTTDQRGEPLDSPLPDIGAFQTQTELVVNITGDGTGASLSDDLSLRQAINLANVLNGTEIITFDSTVFATAQTITLTQGQLELSDTGGMETITGPTAGVTVSGGGQSRVFQVDESVTASITGLTISGRLDDRRRRRTAQQRHNHAEQRHRQRQLGRRRRRRRVQPGARPR